jgi:Uma2 family endonuclease
MATDLLPLTDGGVLVLRPDTDLEDLFSIIDAERHWRCAVFGDELIWVPPANPWSSSLASELGLLLTNRIRALPGPPIRVFGADAGFRIADTPQPHGRLVSPDFAIVRQARLTEHTAPRHGFWPLMPDLALEVRSPGDAPLVWDKKIATYFGISGGTLWAIDPQERSVLVYVDGYPGPGQGAIHERDAVLRVPDVLTGGVPLTVSLVEIWSLA